MKYLTFLYNGQNPTWPAKNKWLCTNGSICNVNVMEMDK